MSEEATRRAGRLSAMGIVQWRRRGSAATPLSAQPVVERESPSAPVAQAASDGGAQAAPGAGVAQLRVEVQDCQRCELARSRIQTVFGVGAESASLMIIGEAPGAEEDARGEPFVGRAGKLLNAMLAAIGLGRDEVYITNILKCRPPRNRDPRGEEVVACSGYLNRQIALVAPRILLAVGRVAAQNLLGVATPIGKLRGREHVHPGTGTPVLVTYHPAYLLRSPLEKRKAWSDLSTLRARLESTP